MLTVRNKRIRKRQRKDLSEDEEDDDASSLKRPGAWSKKDAKKGVFSKAESKAVLEVFEECRVRHQVSVDTVLQEDGRKSSARGLWVDLAERFPERNLHSLYNHVIRKLQPTADGKWTRDDVQRMKDMVNEMGPKWTQIGAALNRAPDSVRRKYGRVKGDFVSGSWTAQEEKNLIKLVAKDSQRTQKKKLSDAPIVQKPQVPKDAIEDDESEDNTHVPIDLDAVPVEGVQWKKIAEKLGTRSASQCSDKWKTLRLKHAKKAKVAASHIPGKKHKHLDRKDTFEFLQKIKGQGGEDEDDIAWRGLGYHAAETRWKHLRRSVNAGMSFAEALNVLIERFDDDSGADSGEKPVVHV